MSWAGSKTPTESFQSVSLKRFGPLLVSSESRSKCLAVVGLVARRAVVVLVLHRSVGSDGDRADDEQSRTTDKSASEKSFHTEREIARFENIS